MPALVLAFMLIVGLLDTAYEATQSRMDEQRETQAQSLGADMLVVRNALRAYMLAEPGAQGDIPLAALGLPSWFSTDADIKTLIDGSQGYVYYTASDTKASSQTMWGQDISGLMGVARAQRLISPGQLTSTILPPSIPENSLVLML